MFLNMIYLKNGPRLIEVHSENNLAHELNDTFNWVDDSFIIQEERSTFAIPFDNVAFVESFEQD